MSSRAGQRARPALPRLARWKIGSGDGPGDGASRGARETQQAHDAGSIRPRGRIPAQGRYRLARLHPGETAVSRRSGSVALGRALARFRLRLPRVGGLAHPHAPGQRRAGSAGGGRRLRSARARHTRGGDGLRCRGATRTRVCGLVGSGKVLRVRRMFRRAARAFAGDESDSVDPARDCLRPMLRSCMNVDVAIVGSGFAGSILAMIARRLGRSVVLLEKGRHPRFAIGESSTPLANLLLEELARSYDLPRLLPLTKWGAWQKAYPEIGCGLKRGFTFYHHTFDQPFAGDPQRSDQLLVGASPRDEVADTHWYRPDFDHFLAREAESAGVVYLDEVELKDVSEQASEVILSGHRRGEPVVIRAQFVVDRSEERRVGKECR